MIEDHSRTPPLQIAVEDLEYTTDGQIGGKGSIKPKSAGSEIYRVDRSAEVVRTFETVNARLDLLKFAKQSAPELEFFTSSHLVIFSNGGISKGCEWSDGEKTEIFNPSAPYVVMFNPAQSYLQLRAPQL